MKISLPVVLLDETLKLISRQYVDGNLSSDDTNPKKELISGVLSCSLMWLAYAVLLAVTPIFPFSRFN